MKTKRKQTLILWKQRIVTINYYFLLLFTLFMCLLLMENKCQKALNQVEHCEYAIRDELELIGLEFE